MATSKLAITQIGASVSGVHALHDQALDQIEDFLSNILTIEAVSGSSQYVPTVGQAQRTNVYKFVDGTPTPSSDTGMSLDCTNIPVGTTFAVQNTCATVIVALMVGGTASTFRGNQCGLLPGETGLFTFDGTLVHQLYMSEQSMSVVEVDTVGTLSEVSSAYNNAVTGASVGGVTLAWADWVCLTDYPWIYRAASSSGSTFGFHPRCGDPTWGDTSAPANHNVLVYCTGGTNAGTWYRYDGSNWVAVPGLAASNIPISFGAFVGGVPTASALLWEMVAVDNITIPDDFANSRAYVRTAPSGAAISFDVQKNGTNIGNFDFADTANTATWATDATTVSLAPGDRLAVVAPANLQSAADLSFMIKATKD